MTSLVKCPACGIKTSAGRDECPRCETTLADAAVVETTAAVPAHLRRAPEPETAPLQRSETDLPEPDDDATPTRPVFDTNIGELFPTRRRFGVVDLLLLAGLIAWLVVLSDVRVWMKDGPGSFATSTAIAGATRAAVPTSPATHPVPAETDRDMPGAASRPPAPAPASMAAGSRLFETGEFEAALAQFEAAVAVAPDDAQARNSLGQTLVRLERRTEALPHLEQATRLDQGRWAYHFNLAHTLGDLGRWNRAIVEYRWAATLFPDDVATRYNLGRALHEWGDYRAAVESYLEAIALAPGEAAFYLSLAQSYEALARPADAVTAYARYLEREPESARADVVRARMDALQRPADDGPGGTQTQ